MGVWLWIVLTIFTGQHASKSPVFRVDFIDHNMDVLRLFVEMVHERSCKLFDDMLFLIGGDTILCDLEVDVGHGK